MATQSERRERTRSQLLATARTQFGARGYAATKMAAVASGAGVAKGAAYHHFETKHDLFETVLQAVSSEIAFEVQSAVAADVDLLETMLAAVRRFFALCAEPGLCQILLKDGPAVLGWERWREIDEENFGGLVRATLSRGMDAGILIRQPVDPLAHLLIGAISEAALNCARQDSFESASQEYIEGLDTLMRGMFKA